MPECEAFVTPHTFICFSIKGYARISLLKSNEITELLIATVPMTVNKILPLQTPRVYQTPTAYFHLFPLNLFLFSIANLVVAGGFGSYMLAMDQRTYELIGPDYPGNRAVDVKNPSLGWMIGFMFVVSFLGLFSLVALRKVLIQDMIPSASLYDNVVTCSFFECS
jgi:hypothetical protein